MSSKKILIVEDDQQFHSFIKEVLNSEEFTLISAYDGLQATEILDEESPDLVITDLLMPDKDGVRLIIEIRTNQPNIPIIAMSGGDSEYSTSFLEAAASLGAAYTLSKPFDADELLKVVAKCLD